LGGSAKKDDRRTSISRYKKSGYRAMFPDWNEDPIAPVNVTTFQNARIEELKDEKDRGQPTNQQYRPQPKKKNYKNLNQSLL